MSVTLTSPDRVLFEGQGLTKRDLADHYERVAELMLPHLERRPLTLVRCPEGSRGECFHQRHATPGLPESIDRVVLEESRGPRTALHVRTLDGLLGLVQVGVLEIHAWGSRVGRRGEPEPAERPDVLVFDVDPDEGLAAKSLVGAVREVRERLARVGLESFLKATGGKGFHVVAPIAPRRGWDEIKAFSRGVAKAMEADAPERYTADARKEARRGRVFVDYLRNARGATAVAPYSTRARPGAPVATPLRWDELTPSLSPSRTGVGNLGRRLAALKSDPWAGFFELRQQLTRRALERYPG